jgi:hypothetical protein
LGVFPETTDSPPLVPETTDEEAPLPAAEVSAFEDVTLVERIRVTEHFLVVEHVPVRGVECSSRPREMELQRDLEAA